MESKEIEFIDNEIINAEKWHNTYAVKQLQTIKAKLQKDHEILEILKKYLKNKSLELGIEDIVICCENEEDYNKVKEWLDD